MGAECKIRVRLLRAGDDSLPTYQTVGSAGMDLKADVDGEIVIPPMGRAKIPTGIAHFRSEEPFPPRKFIERGFNIQQWTDIPEGGHFPAFEKPELMADDIKSFFSKL